MNRFFVFSLAWLLLSAYGLFIKPPNTDGLPLFPHFDKFAHFVIFFGQFWLIARFYTNELRSVPIRKWLLIALIWAIASELIQSQLPSRSADVLDVCADMLGATCALFLAQSVVRRRQQYQTSPTYQHDENT